MRYSTILISFAFVALSSCAEKKKEEGSKRTARNPGLLHLAHAGHSVGSYVGPGGGGGGPHIVIVGAHEPRVITHVASKDSLEELDAELKQHYSGPSIRYVPNSSSRGLLDQAGRQHLSFAGLRGNEYRTSHEYNNQDEGFGYDQPDVSYRTFPLFLHPQHLAQPAPFAQLQPVLGHPQRGQQPVGPTPQYQNQSPAPTYQSSQSPAPSYQNQNSPTPTTANYASPTPFTATPTPLSHTIATPGLPQHVQKLPILQAIPGLQLHNGLQGNFHGPISHQGPIFIPIQALGGHPHHQPLQGQRFAFPRGRNFEYAPQNSAGYEEGLHNLEGENYRNANNDRQSFYDESQGRGLNEYPTVQREFNSAEGQTGGYDSQDFDKNFKYESDESAASPAYRNSNAEDDKSSLENTSLDSSSGERSPEGNSGTFKYSFGNNQGISGRSFPGDASVATSYQSVTFETHSVPVYQTRKA